jgi:mono/diheme cytochrome c family protein
LKKWIAAGAPETGSAGVGTSSSGDAWTGGIDQVIDAKCATCHINAQMGDLSLKTYADALKGGKDGPAIVPGDPDKSVLVQIQQKGGHPGQLSADELNRVIAWIKAGAPETSGASSSRSATPSTVTWTGDIGPLFGTTCAACHVNAQMGDLSLKTYADALKGGKDGPAIVPGNPDQSVLVQIQSKGGHPGQLTADELAKVVAWIKAGAPEK